MGYCNIKALVAIVISFQVVYLVVNVMHQDKGGYYSRTSTTPSPLMTTEVQVNESVEAFLYEYEAYCEQFLLPNRSENSYLPTMLTSIQPFCQCIPNGLVGHTTILNETDESIPSVGELELQHDELIAGGQWTPRSCVPRQNIAIIIPYRDREEHLRALLNILHPMLQRQMLQYTIYVVEQAEPAVFNKASLMNAAFVIARSEADYDCYIFHDVDMLPEDDRNFYVCSLVPRHVGSHLSKWNYKVPYEGLFGGVTAFRREHFELVNGFSNQYYGWGGEDDDMYNRILAKNLSITRFTGSIARFTMVKHKSDAGNPSSPYRNNALKFRPKLYKFDGLNSLRYKLIFHERRPLYTWLYVKLPPHPVYFRGTFRTHNPAGTTQNKVSILLLCMCLTLIYSATS